MPTKNKVKAPAKGCKAPKVSTAKPTAKTKKGKVEVMRSALAC